VGLFALIAGVNFATHFAFLRGRRLSYYWNDPELRWFLGFVLTQRRRAVALLLWQRDVFLDLPSALRYAVFNTISVATTLGFATTDYGQWPFFAGLWLLFLCSFCNWGRLHRRRHQDDARHPAVQAGLPRTEKG
jgi:trk system potassium uptake protein TrkH